MCATYVVRFPNSGVSLRVRCFRGLKKSCYGQRKKAEEIKMFYRRKGIIDISSAPDHPVTNGQAERMMQELKRALFKGTKEELQCILARFLFNVHTTVSLCMDKTPAWMLFGNYLH